MKTTQVNLRMVISQMADDAVTTVEEDFSQYQDMRRRLKGMKSRSVERQTQKKTTVFEKMRTPSGPNSLSSLMKGKERWFGDSYGRNRSKAIADVLSGDKAYWIEGDDYARRPTTAPNMLRAVTDFDSEELIAAVDLVMDHHSSESAIASITMLEDDGSSVTPIRGRRKSRKQKKQTQSKSRKKEKVEDTASQWLEKYNTLTTQNTVN